ncbi:DUF1127 domain-containing protein [Mesorhizobium sp. ANAO-SY3R2]|uniref:DUF1127 domain-containing protein n=1 Tax=Mesorhizobium sp. ANAO-SY3R2 TaxID=3166644 RepID=UPI00366E1AA4
MTTTTANGASLLRPTRTLFRAFRFLSRCYNRYQQRLDLSELSDEALDDIGLTRRDVTRECSQPFWR